MRERAPLMHHPDPGQPRDKWDGVPNGAATVEAPRRPGERLSRERMRQVVAGVANNEMKLFTLGAMVLDPKVYNSADLDRQQASLQRGKDGWVLSRGGAYSHCTDSFAQVSLVVKEEIGGDRRKIGYRPTQAGMDALPLIGHLLEFSERHTEFSLQQLLSVTNIHVKTDADSPQDPSSVTRAPENRLDIFTVLLGSQNPVRLTDLAGEADVSSVGSHVENLSLNRFVTYEHPDQSESYIHFRSRPELMTEDAIAALPKLRFIVKPVRDIAEIAREYPVSLSTREYVDLLKERFPEYRTVKRVYATVNRVLGHLTRHGMMDRTEIDRRARSFVSLSDPQRKLLTEFMKIIDGFEKGDETFLQAGEQKAREILGDPARVAAIAKKTLRFSKGGNVIGAEGLQNEILALADQSGERGVMSMDVVTLFSGKVGRGHVSSTLLDMYNEGVLDRKKVGRKWVYTRAPKKTPDAESADTEKSNTPRTSELAQSTPQVVFDARAHYERSTPALGDLMGEEDPLKVDTDALLTQRNAARRASAPEPQDRTKRRGK